MPGEEGEEEWTTIYSQELYQKNIVIGLEEAQAGHLFDQSEESRRRQTDEQFEMN